MNYLLYIEHSAENLQFFLWYRDYVKRFALAQTADTRLSPEWTQAMEDETTARIQKDAVERMRREPKALAAILKGTVFDKGADVAAVDNGNPDPFSTPPPTPSIKSAPSFLPGSHYSGYRTRGRDAFSAVGATQPCTFFFFFLFFSYTPPTSLPATPLSYQL